MQLVPTEQRPPIPAPDPLQVAQGRSLIASGLFPRIARIPGEHHNILEDPAAFVATLNETTDADIFTFVQPVTDPVPRHKYHLAWDELAVLHFESYDSWWKNQLNDKTRNMVRKAAKKGVAIRTCACNDDFIAGVKEIYDESPVRQGKPFKHYNKSLSALRESHLTFADRSEFIGAYHDERLIGFIKMIYNGGAATIMQIVSMIAHRDRAPTNALLAKAVEICAERNIHYILYGSWSRRSMGDFKRHHRFEKVRVPRFYVPLNRRGAIALKLGLHRNILAMVPERWLDWGANLRSQWYSRRLPARGN